MHLTVLICTKNRAASLARTLAALETLHCDRTWETVVVDNGSDDNTAEVVRAAAAATGDRVRYLRCDSPGKSSALNAGIAAAAGRVIAFTDDDALPGVQWLDRICGVFEDYRCDWAFGRIVPHWESASPKWFSEEFNGLFALLDLGADPFVADGRTPAFFGVNCAVTREALAQIGRYRADLGPTTLLGGGGEDTEMFARALGAGQKIIYHPAIEVAHVIPPERTTRAFHRRRMMAGRFGHYRFLQASGGPGPRILGIPRYHYRLALTDLARWISAVLRRDVVARFASEIRLIRFAGLLQQGAAHRGRAPVPRQG